MLDRYLIRYFLAVVDQGNFSRAASHCRVSQPTLSIGIAKLERMLERQLFVRSNQRVELTDAGAQFLTHARRIERAFNEGALAMSLTGDSGGEMLRIGILSSIAGAPIAAGLRNARHRSTGFELLFGTERELVAHLAKGRIDVALSLVDRGGDRFLEAPILTEGYALAMSTDHPLAGEDSIAPEVLANDNMIVRRHCEALSETSRFFTERGVRPHFTLRSTNDERVMQMVAAGVGVTVMPLCYRMEGVARPLLNGFRATRSLGWAAAHHAEHLIQDRPGLMTGIEAALHATV